MRWICTSVLALLVFSGIGFAQDSICDPCVDPPLNRQLAPGTDAAMHSARIAAFRRAIGATQQPIEQSEAPIDAEDDTVPRASESTSESGAETGE